MLRIGEKRVPAVEAQPSGVIFDPYYTDSLIRTVVPNLSASGAAGLGTAAARPPREFMAALVLYGTAHLSQPTWLPGGLPNEFARLVDENLVRIIPDEPYDTGASLAVQIAEYADDYAVLSHAPIHGRLMPDGSVDTRDMLEAEFEREIEIGEAVQNTRMAESWLASVEPLLRASLDHLQAPGTVDPMDYELLDLFVEQDAWDLNSTDRLRTFKHLGWSESVDRSLARAFCADVKAGAFKGSSGEEIDLLSAQARLLDATVTAFALDTYASRTGLPLQSSHQADRRVGLSSSRMPEAEQLLRIQFEEMRYPIIETIDDVLRLRDDRHVEQYRLIINEFSERLALEIEAGKWGVVTEFRQRLQEGLDAMHGSQKWERRAQIPFFVRVALAAGAAAAGIPMLDLAATEVWQQSANFAARRAIKGKEWILFGRPGVDM